MAERVEIRGGDLDGSRIENAASEATLLRLVEAFEKKNGGTAGGAGSGNKIQEMYNKAQQALTRGSNSLGDSFDKTKKAADSLSSGLMSFVTKGLDTVISGATFAVRSFTDFLSASFAEYRNIADTGVTFGNNMVEVSKTALSAGMSMSGFTEMVKQNTSILTALGGTAGDGAKRLAELRDGIINSELGTRFYGLGLATKDIEEYTGSYVNQLQRLGSLQRRDNASITNGIATYVEELDKVTKLTGIERKRLDEQAKRIAMDPVFDAIRRALNPAQLAKSSANLAMVAEMGGNELEDAIKELSTGVINSDLGRELARVGAITQQEALAIAQGTADAGPILQKALSVLNRQGEYAEKGLLQANAALRAGNTARMKLSRLEDANFQKAQEEQKKRSALTEAFGKIPAVFDNIRNKIMGAFLNSKIFEKLIKIFEYAAEKLNKYVDPIVAYFGKLFEEFSETLDSQGLMAALKKSFVTLGTDFKEVVVPEFKKLMTDVFGSDTIVTDFGKFVKDGIKSLMDSIVGGGSTASSITSVITNGFKGLMRAALDSLGLIKQKPVVGQRGRELGGTEMESVDTGSILADIDWSPITSMFGSLFQSMLKSIFETLGLSTERLIVGSIAMLGAILLAGVSGPFALIGVAIAGIFGYEKVKEWLSAGWEALKDLGTGIANMFSWESIKGFFSSAFDTILAVPRAIIGLFTGESSIEGLFKSAVDLIFFVPNTILKLFNMESVSTMFGNAWKTITDIPGKIAEWFNFKDLKLPSISELINDFFGKIKNLFNFELPNLSDILPSWLGGKSKPTAASENAAPTAPTASAIRGASISAPNAQILVQGVQSSTTSTATTTAQTADNQPASIANNTQIIEALEKTNKMMIEQLANSPTLEQSRQLNTLLEQLVAVNKQQLEVNQDLLKATKGSYNPV